MIAQKALASISLLRPFFTWRFWRLLVKTVALKRAFRSHEHQNYLDYMAYYYTRTRNPLWERVNEDKWRPIREAMIAMAELQPGDVILDLATGAGFQAEAFSARGYRVMGIDYVFDRLTLAQQRRTRLDLGWVTADGARLPLRTDSCDVVSISLALHDMPLEAIRSILNEIGRVARRRVVIAEPRLPQNWLIKYPYSWLADTFDESLYMQEYLAADIEDLFHQAALKPVAVQGALHDLLAIYACEPLNDR